MASEDRTLMVIAVIAVIVSVVGLGVSLSKANVTGRVTDTGTANFTVEEKVAINFTTDIIDWGNGSVTEGKSAAYLDTQTGTVTNGNWTAVSNGLVLENIGNKNVTLDMKVGQTAAQFIGGTSPSYQWSFNDNINGENGGCTFNTTNVPSEDTMQATSTSNIRVCNVFQYADANDVLEINFNLTVPSDSITGARGDIITATATAI
ncbi:MAG: hypothetical protein D6707_11155 [Bacteroidetes bacterium]|nr:MAG: hypothetical protein D6707_11155 [Bacteroidota bacterium]